jgi:uncharacterized cupin superfamily protein
MPDAPQTVIKAADVTARTGTSYLPQYAGQLKGREKRILGDVFGLTQFGVNLMTLAPGSWSSHRHWHEAEDEFIYVLEGEVTLVDDQGEHRMTAGICAGFKAGVPNGHHLINKSGQRALVLELGTRAIEERSHYSDVDMFGTKKNGKWTFTRRDGSPG